MLTLPDNPDPLGVLTSTFAVVEQASSVRINLQAIERLAEQIINREFTPPAWESELHWSGDPDRTANFLLVLDALNFCFWGEPRWVVTYDGQRYNGYSALAAALTRAMYEGVPLTDAGYLATIDEATVAAILAGEHTVPLLPQRADNLREVGRVLRDRHDGQFSHLIRQADKSAMDLVQRVIRALPSFNDVASDNGREIRFYKRAQILASDLAGSFGGRDLGEFHDLEQLTAFADYKVPQVLHHLDILSYSPTLLSLLDDRTEIAAGDPLEIEIRAATIWGVEALRQALEHRGVTVPPYQLDWLLWQLGQDLPGNTRPYHRTRTIYY